MSFEPNTDDILCVCNFCGRKESQGPYGYPKDWIEMKIKKKINSFGDPEEVTEVRIHFCDKCLGMKKEKEKYRVAYLKLVEAIMDIRSLSNVVVANIIERRNRDGNKNQEG
jgi:hypothetical protein